MEKVVTLGIAGIGNAGHAVLRSLGKVDGVILTAIADVRKEAVEPFSGKNKEIETFDSVEKMCNSRNVDAVWIATPNEFHEQHTIAAANYGKHVICEKPMALSLNECDRMVEATKKNSVQLLMHSKVSESPIVKMREVVASGRLGRVIQVNTWNYKGWLNSPRLPSEVDTSKGGGVLYRQGPHQIDIVRYIGGGMARSVRAVAGRWNPHFDTEGNFTAFLEFEDGTPATLVFNGYGYFDITELTWGIGEGGGKVSDYFKRDRPTAPVDASARTSMPLRAETRQWQGDSQQPFYGLTLVSCERGDIRQSPDGLYLYTGEGREEIFCSPHLDRGIELQKLHEAVVHERPVFPDGLWGRASLEVALAILQSSREGREIYLSRQVPTPS
ncbi:MAG: Gfo/Idh/MocA family protein [Candidatus Binatia bacterium]